MTVSLSLQAYLDCLEVYDWALDAEHGVRVRVKSADAAWHFRLRMHQARKLVRLENAKTFEEDHPMYGRSAYDVFTLRIRDVGGVNYVYIQPNRVVAGAVEILTEEDTITALEASPPQRQIPSPPTTPLQITAPTGRVIVLRRI